MNPQDKITPAYIRKAMASLGITAQDIVEDSGIDKASLSVLLSGKKPLTKWHKFAFYYYFRSLL